MKLTAALITLAGLGAATALTIWQRNQATATVAETARVSTELAGAEAILRSQDQEIAVAGESAASAQAELVALARPQEELPSWKSVPLGEANWETDASFVDVPKWVLNRIQVTGLSFESQRPEDRGRGIGPALDSANAQVGPEAAVLLGLTESERAVVRENYLRAKSSFEQIERERFARTDVPLARAARLPGEKASFIIPPFPEEQEALKLEWEQNLERTLGRTRAALIATYATAFNPARPGSIASTSNALSSALSPHPLSDWLRLATNETRITVVFAPPQTNNGKVVLGQTNFHYATGTGDSGASSLNRWPHLLTLEVLAARP